MSARVCNVVMVEDDRTVREAVTLLINTTPGFHCMGSYESAEDALRSIRSFPPDVLLLDIHLPGMLGSEAAREFHERFPGLPILMFTVFEDEDAVFESLCNGACGYLLKKTPPAKLIEALQDATAGGAPMSPEIAGKVVRMFRDLRAPVAKDHDLTPQEVRLLALLAEGHSYQTAADQLEISINTIRNYIRSIYEKLHVHSKSEAVSKALKSGII
jgi:DNA-binding NarL/FixJ family response regulator